MTLPELNYKLFKAHTLLCIGTMVGYTIAHMHHLRHPLLVGLSVGLLFSINIYRKCVAVLIAEYKRLKHKKENEKKNIS